MTKQVGGQEPHRFSVNFLGGFLDVFIEGDFVCATLRKNSGKWADEGLAKKCINTQKELGKVLKALQLATIDEDTVS